MKTLYKPELRPLPLLSGDFLSTLFKGEYIDGEARIEFQKQLAKQFGFKYAIVTQNAFAALVVSLLSLDRDQDRVIVPDHCTCHAVTNAVLAAGKKPVFCPIDAKTLCYSKPALIELTTTCSVVISTSLFGICSELDYIRHSQLTIIEDAAQSFMTRSALRSGADFLVLSFYPTKQFNCIIGGAVLTRESNVAAKLEELVTYSDQYTLEDKPRLNLRLPNIFCALGASQMRSLDRRRAGLIAVHKRYMENVEMRRLLFKRQVDNIGKFIPQRLLVTLPEEARQELMRKRIGWEPGLYKLNSHISYDRSRFKDLYSLPFSEYLSYKRVDEVSRLVVTANSLS